MANATEVIIPSTKEDRAAIKQILNHVSDSFTKIEMEREAIKDFVSEISETFDLPKKQVNQLAKVFHKLNMNQVRQDANDLEELYDAIIGETI